MKRRRSLFFRYVVTYMAVCVVTIAFFAVFLYQSNVKTTNREIADRFTAALSQAGAILDDRMRNLYELSVVLQARRATEEIRRLSAPVPASAVTKINEYSRELQPYNYSNAFIHELILYFSKSGMFISSNSVGLYPDVYFRVVLKYTDIGYAAWRDALLAPQFMSHRRFTDERTGERFVDVLQDLPLSGGSDKVVMIARVAAEEFVPGLRDAIDGGAEVLLYDYRGETVYATNPALVPPPSPASDEAVLLGGEPYVPITVSLESTGWTYTMLVPTRTFLAGRQQFLRTLALLILSVLLTGALLSVLLSVWGMAPIRRLLVSLRKAGHGAALSGGNELVRLDANIQSLIQNNQTLQAEVTRYQALNRANFLDRLLGSGFASAEDLMIIARHAGIVIEHRCYVLAVLELAGYNDNAPNPEFIQEMDTATIVVTDFLARQVADSVIVHRVDFSHTALIFCLDTPAQASAAQEEAERLSRAAAGRLNLMLRCAVSETVVDANLFGTVYPALCRRLRGTNLLSGEAAPPDAPDDAGEYRYPIDLETKLLNYLLAGNEKDALALLGALRRDNEAGNALTAQGTLLLLSAARGTLIRANNEMDVQDSAAKDRLRRITHPPRGLAADAQWAQLHEAVSLLCGAVDRKRNERNTVLIERVNHFIEANYADCQLDLTMVAGALSLTGNYLSYFYKSQTGENISAIIERTRMARAEALLRKGGRPIKDICAQVGYTNLNTFYKAFRRIYGMSPKGYADQHGDPHGEAVNKTEENE